eukprot:gene19695-26386_t
MFVLVKKLLNGDVSDNIPPLIKGESDAFYLELALDPIKLQRTLVARKLEEAFEKNRRLIDFNLVPEHYKDEVMSSWNDLECIKKVEDGLPVFLGEAQ